MTLSGLRGASRSIAPEQRRTAQRWAIAANMGLVAVGMSVGSMSGDIVQLYAVDVLGLDPEQVGFALALLVVGTVVQILAMPVTERHGSRRVMVVGYSASAALLTAFFVMPDAIAWDPSLGFLFFVSVLVLFECLQAASWGTAWMPWMRRLTLPEERGRFLSRMRITTNLCAVAVVLGFSRLAGEQVRASDYNILVGGLIAYFLFSTLVMSRLPDRIGPPEDTGAPGAPQHRLGMLKDSASRLLRGFRDRQLRALLVVLVLSVTSGAPLFVVYAVNVLGLSSGVVGVLISLRVVMNVVAFLLVGALTDRYGARAVLMGGGALICVVGGGWLFAPLEGGVLALSGQSLVGALFLATVFLEGALALVVITGLHNAVTESNAVPMFTGADVLDTLTRRGMLWFAGVLIGAAQAGVALLGIGLDPYRLLLASGIAGGPAIMLMARAVQGHEDRVDRAGAADG